MNIIKIKDGKSNPYVYNDIYMCCRIMYEYDTTVDDDALILNMHNGNGVYKDKEGKFFFYKEAAQLDKEIYVGKIGTTSFQRLNRDNDIHFLIEINIKNFDQLYHFVELFIK